MNGNQRDQSPETDLRPVGQTSNPSAVYQRWAGRTVGAKYTVDRFLADGGMGAVFLGHHRELGAEIAIKIMHAHVKDDQTLRERFRREALALARINHPGVVRVHDFGEDSGDLYLIMDRAQGRTLADVFDDEGPLGVPYICHLFAQLLRAVQAIHDADVVHRDLKPDNVFVSANAGRLDHIKIVDFGLSVNVNPEATQERLTQTGEAFGTPHYMAPEQCRGQAAVAASDVYSLGCMLYEVLSGVPPFDGTDPAQLIAQQLFGEAPPIASVGYRRDVGRGIEAVVRKMLLKKAEARPSALELVDALDSALRGLDPESMRENAINAKLASASRDREDRAITMDVAAKNSGNAAPLLAASAPHARREDSAGAEPAGRVLLIASEGSEEARGYRDALAVDGLRATLHTKPGPIPMEVFGEPIALYLVEHLTRVQELRALDKTFVVFGLAAKDVAAAIREGASDAVLTGAKNEQVTRKVRQGIQRRNRSLL
jgi:eukaryotic-like serine/threonine-protein kinase